MEKKKIKFGLAGFGVLVVIATGLVFMLGRSRPEEPLNVPQRERILKAEVEDCRLEVETNFRKFEVETNIGKVYPRIECFEPFHRTVSGSDRFLAFEDLSGGVDRTVEVYSVDKKDAVRLEVLGTSRIMDMKFGGGDVLLILHGYPDVYDRQFLARYDVAGLFSEYPENVRLDGGYFANVKLRKQVTSLPPKGENYARIEVGEKGVELYGESGDLLKKVEL